MRKPIVAGAIVASLAIGGTAVAASGGPEGLFSGDPRGAFADDLAAELDGVTPGEVENALETVAEERMAEHNRALAESISEHLDGVAVADIEDALAAAHERMRESLANDDLPKPGLFTQVLAEELGVGEDEIESALEAGRENAADEFPGPSFHREIEPGGPIGPGGPPHVEFAIPVPEAG